MTIYHKNVTQHSAHHLQRPAITAIVSGRMLSQSTVRHALQDPHKASPIETEQQYHTKGGKRSLLYKIRNRQHCISAEGELYLLNDRRKQTTHSKRYYNRRIQAELIFN